jgi:hypothetical protein
MSPIRKYTLLVFDSLIGQYITYLDLFQILFLKLNVLRSNGQIDPITCMFKIMFDKIGHSMNLAGVHVIPPAVHVIGVYTSNVTQMCKLYNTSNNFFTIIITVTCVIATRHNLADWNVCHILECRSYNSLIRVYLELLVFHSIFGQ